MRIKSFLIGLVGSLFILTPAIAGATYNPLSPVCQVGTPAYNSAVCNENASQQTKGSGVGNNPVVDKIQAAANIVATITGIAAVIIAIYSGFMYVTAGGAIGGQRSGDNPTRAKQARASLIGALIGVVLVAMAWTIVTFVTEKLIK